MNAIAKTLAAAAAFVPSFAFAAEASATEPSPLTAFVLLAMGATLLGLGLHRMMRERGCPDATMLFVAATVCTTSSYWMAGPLI